MRHTICVSDCLHGMAALLLPAAERFNDRALQYWAWAPSHHHHPLTQGLHWVVKFLKYLLKPVVPQAPSPFPHTQLKITASLCHWPLQEALNRSPLTNTEQWLSLAEWPPVRLAWHCRQGLIAGSRWDPFTWLPLGLHQTLCASGKTHRARI